MDKTCIRKEMIQKRLDLDTVTYMSKSNFIIESLEKMEFFKKAKTIGVYVSMKQEVDTLVCIKRWCIDKRICIPRVDKKTMDFYHIQTLSELEVGTFGVLEPQTNVVVPVEDIDLLIVPLLAFDKYKNRIGYGGGYYDRYLQTFKGIKIGVAFSFQEVEKIKVEKHDIALDGIIHEKGSTILGDLL